MNYNALYKQVRGINPHMPQMFDDNIRLIYRKVICSGDHVIDCGSHTGKHTFPLAECVGSHGKVFAYEPILEKNKITKQRIMNEKIKNIELREYAVGEFDVEGVTFNYIRDDPGKSAFQLRMSQNRDDLDIVHIQTKIINLDSELINHRISFIKMDVEGYEYKALMGATHIIEKHRPVVCIEHGSRIYKDQVDSGEYFRYFDERNYVIYDILGNYLETEEDFRESASAAGVWDYWMAPKERMNVESIAEMLRNTYIVEKHEPTVAITVGVACYNAGEYLEDCITSLLNQTFGDFEIIIVNDGSTDRSALLLEEMAGNNKQMTILNQQNMGQGVARNRILVSAKGKYITFVDADDWLAPECLEAAYGRAVRNDLDIISFGWVRTEKVSGPMIDRRRDYKGRRFDDPEQIRQDAFSARLNLMCCASLVRTALFHDHGLRYTSYKHEDIYVTPFLYLYASRHAYINEDYYFWRIREGSTTQTISKDHIDGIVGAFYSWRNRLLTENIFSKYRSAFVSGTFAYISTLCRRIEDADIEYKETVSYLRNKVRSIPEIKEYGRYLTSTEMISRKEVIKLIEDEVTSMDDSKSDLDRMFSNLFDANKKFRDRLNRIKIEKTNNRNKISFDYAFAPHKDYHVTTAFPIAELLRKDGFSVAFLDFTDIHRDEGVHEMVDELEEKHCHDICNFIASGYTFRNLIVFNDWDRQTTHPLVLDAQHAGITTIGFVEGINDFNDVDTGRQRRAYRTVEWIFATGENDRQFFRENWEKFRIVGFVRIAESLRQPYRAPKRTRAVINVNFTYGVLEEYRNKWLSSAIEGCQLAEMDYVISQHPADKSDLSGYPLDSRSFEELMKENAILISRFSSCIIEALAMGRVVVYHNPCIENVDKFKNPLGAYSMSTDASTLAKSLMFELQHQSSVIERRKLFLTEHCDFSENFDPHAKSARVLKEIHGTHVKLLKKSESVSGSDSAEGKRTRAQIVEAMSRWLLTPTAVILFAGLALSCAGLSDLAWSVWLAAAGVMLVGVVIAKEAVLWRWRREEDRKKIKSEIFLALSAERQRSETALSKALSVERQHAERALSKALSAERQHTERALSVERQHAERALSKALSAERQHTERALSGERQHAERALSKALSAERQHTERALSGERQHAERALSKALSAERQHTERALSGERQHAERALSKALSAERQHTERALSGERQHAERALSKALSAERQHTERALSKALESERSSRSLVDVHLADRGLPVRRILLLFTIHRSGSTWLFDMLRTHPAVRVEPTARVWRELGIDGWRYPGAFHNVDGAWVPIEVTGGLGAAIPAYSRAEIPDVKQVDDADRWAVEKAHPQFVEFDANRLAARIQNLRERGVDVEVIYGVRNPLHSMWSMAEFKDRDPNWYGRLPIEEIPEFIAKSLDVLAKLYDLVGGNVVDYEDLPDSEVMTMLCQRLDPSWGAPDVEAWLAHATAVTQRSRRRQRPDSGFLGESNRYRDEAGPDHVWVPKAAIMAAAEETHRGLTSRNGTDVE